MTKKEYAEINIGMTFDFIRQLIDHPDVIDKMPNGSELDFIDKDMPVTKKERVKGKKLARYRVGRVFEPVKG